MRYKKIVGDAFLNVIASSVPLVLLQLALLPLIAARVTDDEYGLVVTLVALLSLVPTTLGNVLNNVRLLQCAESDDRRPSSSFSLIVLVSTAIAVLVTFCVAVYYADGVNPTSTGMALLAFLAVYREYLMVSYRLDLNYRAIVASSFYLAVGYLVGYGLFALTGWWELVYMVGLASSLAYMLLTTHLWREPLSPDSQLAGSAKDTAVLFASSMLGRSTTYADRMVIFPMLGGFEVSVYYVATLFGKILSMGVSPVSSVMLSYLARLKARPKRAFWYSLGLGLALSVVAYGITIGLSRPVLLLLYPQFADQAMDYVWLVTITAYVNVLISIADPYVLRFLSLKWQVFENGLFCLLYFALALTLLGSFGLMGFCLGSLIATGAKLVFLLLVYCFAEVKSSHNAR